MIEIVSQFEIDKTYMLCAKMKNILGALLISLFIGACGRGDGEATPNGGAFNKTEIVGESIVLIGQTEASLRRPLLFVRNVWGVDSRGIRIDFTNERDWIASKNGISRTQNSRIPDFSHYSVKLNMDGKFSFSSEPRNPPVTIPFQVYVDYVSTYPESNVNPAKNATRPRKVVCLGDSISAGSHTISNYFKGEDSDSYCGLLRTFLGSSAQVFNPSVPGGTLKLVPTILPEIIESKPDLLIIEFGMNDHVLYGFQGLSAFELNLEKSVHSALGAGVKVILVGFFQQNAGWELENPTLTKAYNQAIERVANKMQVPFIDIFKAFTQSATGTRIIEFLTGDFMHHPNNYGHRIYFSLIIPHVLEKPTKSSLIPAYVNLN